MGEAGRGSVAQGKDSACSTAAARAAFSGEKWHPSEQNLQRETIGKDGGGGRQAIKIFKSGHTAAKSGDFVLFSIIWGFFFCSLTSGVISACSSKFCGEISSC